MSLRLTDVKDLIQAPYSEIREGIERMGSAFEAFKATNDERLEAARKENLSLKERLEELESRASSPGKTGGRQYRPDGPELWTDLKSGLAVPVLEHKHRLGDIVRNDTGVDLGEWLRYTICGSYADDRKELRAKLQEKALATSPDSAGGFTVPQPLAAEFIDLLRSALVISRAGARSIPMTTKTLSMAKLASDVSAAWHAENASVTASDPTFAAVTLTSKTVVALTKMSLEVSQDSLNIQDMLTRSLTGSMASAIDQAGLGNTVANGPSGILSFSGRNQLTSVGSLTNYDEFLDAVGLLLASNVPLENIGPIILGTGAFTALNKLKTGLSSDQTPLVRPPALTMPFLPTTAVQTGSPQTSTAYMGMWSDLFFGVRQDITIRILPEVFLGSNLQIGVLAYARVDFAAARESSFVTLEGITH